MWAVFVVFSSFGCFWLFLAISSCFGVYLLILFVGFRLCFFCTIFFGNFDLKCTQDIWLGDTKGTKGPPARSQGSEGP